MSLNKERERLLVEQLKQREPKAFEELVIHYRKKIIYVINCLVKNYEIAEELAQEVLMKVYEKIDSYSPYYAFSTWLFRVATNHAIDYLRKVKIQYISIYHFLKGKDGEEREWEVPDTNTQTSEPILPATIEKIDMLVNQLDEKYKEVIVLRFFQDLSYEEIAENLKIPVGTVKVRLHRAKQKLSQLLKKQDVS